MDELEKVDAAIMRLQGRKPETPDDNLRDYAVAALVGGLMLWVQDGQWFAAIFGAAFALRMIAKYIAARHTFESWSWDMASLVHRRRLILESPPETVAFELAAFDGEVKARDAKRHAREEAPVTRLLLFVCHTLAARHTALA